MATTVRELLVEFGVDADSEQLDLLKRGLDNVKSGLSRIVKVAGAAGAALAGVGGALVAQASKTAEYAHETREAANNLGLTTTAFQELRFAGQKFGADSADIQDALATISDRAEDAKSGMQSFVDDFALANVEVDQLRNKSPGELFQTFVEQASKMDSKSKQVAAAVRIFGDDLGRRLLPIIRRGGDDLAAMRQEAHELGVVMSEGEISDAAQLRESMNSIQQTVKGLRNQLGAALAPVLDDLIGRFQSWVKANQGLIEQRIDQFAKQAAEAFRQAADVIAWADDQVQKVGGWATVFKWAAGAVAAFGAIWAATGVIQTLIGFGQIIVAVSGYIGTAISAMGSLVSIVSTSISAFSAMSGSLAVGISATLGWILALVAAVAAVGYAIYDVIQFIRGADSYTGQLVATFREWWGSAQGIIAGLQAIWSSLKMIGDVIVGLAIPVFESLAAVGMAVWEVIEQGALILWTFLKGTFNALWALARPIFTLIGVVAIAAFKGIAIVAKWLWSNILSPFVNTVANWFIWLFNGIAAGISAAGSAIRSALSSVFGWLQSQFEWIGGWIDWLSESLASLFGIEVGKAADEAESAAKEVQKAKDQQGDDDDDDDDDPPATGPAADSGGSGGDGAGKSGEAANIESAFGGSKGSKPGTGGGLNADGPQLPGGLGASGAGAAAAGATKSVTVNFDSGDMDVTIEVPPDADAERIREEVRELMEQRRQKQKQEIRDSIVKGGER